MPSKKILFLRPFTADPDGTLIVILAGATIKEFGQLIVVCPPERRREIEAKWHSTGIPKTFESVFLVVESDESKWRSVIAAVMQVADAVILHLLANDNGFSHWSIPTQGVAYDPASLYMVPLSDPMTGPGLLHEIGLLGRTRLIPRTVLLCKAEEMDELSQRIHTAQFAATSGHIHTASGRSLIPRLTALDKQLAHIADVRIVLPYSIAELDNGYTIAGLIGRLRGAIYSALDSPEMSSPPAPAGCVPVGPADEPRPMAPDGRSKILSTTGPEDLVIVPAGELCQVSTQEMRTILSPQGVERGCPYCYADIESIFFYVESLNREDTDTVRGKCQRCGRRSTVWDDILMDT